MATPGAVEGECARRFAPVRAAFAANFAAGREVGASFAATVGGEPVVDLWGGFADRERTRVWQRDTIVNVFSTTKAMTALSAHVLVDRGLLDPGAAVARYWPEFAEAGKASLPVHYLLSHRAGLAAIRTPLPQEALYDWNRMTATLAAETPWWPPGSTSGYHALTFGYLVGELIRRVTGTLPGRFFRNEIAGPLGADFHLGLGASEDHRVAEIVPPSPEERAATAVDPDSLLGKIMANPLVTPEVANQRAWRGADIPAANGHGNARSVARVMAALACGGTLGGVRLLGETTIARATAVQFDGTDLVLGMPMRWGLGFMMATDHVPLGPNRRSFGHGGWGGSLGIADPDARVSWAYVMNRMSPGTTGDSRAGPLVDALYAAL